jgi:Helicase conserved C-terminal domain
MGVRFESYFARLTESLVADMAKSWGVDKKLSQGQNVQAIIQALNDPKQVQRLIAGLQPYERLALEIVKSEGGQISSSMLAIVLRLLGVEHPFNIDYNSDDDLAKSLISSGVFIPEINRDRYYNNPNYEILMSDERILAQLGSSQFPPLPLLTTTAPSASSYRSPASVVFSILGFMQAVADLGGIKLTKSRTPQVNSLRKLMKAQRWEENGTLIDGFWFPQPTVGMGSAFTSAKVLIHNSEESILALASPVEVFANRPYLTQIKQILSGFIVSSWAEWSLTSSINVERYVEGRQILLQVLKLLPVDTQDWYSLDDLEKFLYERIGDRFSLGGYMPSPQQLHHIAGKESEQVQRWREARQKDWQKREKQWLPHAFGTWLYFLGIVELGLSSATTEISKEKSSKSLPPNQTDAIVSFRLTDLGRALLHPELASHLVEIAPQPAWIVQPNFEILVYLDQVAPSQIVFLDRYAERIDLQQHTAQYRLTRESVYQGLERGSSLEEFIDLLRTGAKVALPQNVEIDIRQWGGLREQITLRRDTQILEFPDPQTMQAAIAQGLKGRIFRDRFVLLDANTPSVDVGIKQRINYDQPPDGCLSVSEIGEVKQTQPVVDLLLETHLTRWMEPRGENWALTQASVMQAVRSGNKANDILEFLEDRLTHKLPRLLKVALSAWAGQPPTLEMQEIVVLRCANSEVFTAIAKSKKLQAHFAGQLAPDVLLVKRSQLQKLKQDLEWLGINPVEQLTIKE